jgi:hypothetical protein
MEWLDLRSRAISCGMRYIDWSLAPEECVADWGSFQVRKSL